jgi:hypothetical protein
MPIVHDDWPDRNTSEPRRAAYRLGWTAARYLTDPSLTAWWALWPALRLRYPDAPLVECAAAFQTAWYRRERTPLAATAED